MPDDPPMDAWTFPHHEEIVLVGRQADPVVKRGPIEAFLSTDRTE